MEFIEQEKYKDKFGIYAIKNKINNKVYVGQTGQKFLRRFWHHQWKLKDNTHDNNYLQNAWNKYGDENFEFIVLQELVDKSLLDDYEIKYIDKYKNENKSYNMLLGGGGRRGYSMTEHTKKLVGEKNRIHMLGTKHSEETKLKMSKARAGKHVDKKTDILDEKIVFKIKSMLIQGNKASNVSKELSVDYKLINNLIANNTWKTVHVDGWEDYLLNRKTYTRLTKEDHKEIYRLYIEECYDKNQLAEMYDRTDTMISKIIRKYSNQSYDNPVPSLNEVS